MESRTEKLTGDAGLWLPREALDRNALIAHGWGDHCGAARLHDDPVLAFAANDPAGVGAAEDTLAL